MAGGLLTKFNCISLVDNTVSVSILHAPHLLLDFFFLFFLTRGSAHSDAALRTSDSTGLRATSLTDMTIVLQATNQHVTNG